MDKAILKLFLDTVRESARLADDLRSLKDAGTLDLVSPELAMCWGERGQQDPKWHPEGSTWEHVCLVVSNLPEDASFRLRLAAVFHDVGKPYTFKQYADSGGISNHGHAEVGAFLFRSAIGPRLDLDPQLIDDVATIIDNHMLMHYASDRSIVSEKLFEYLINLPVFNEMLELQHADALGSGHPEDVKLARSQKEFLLDKRS